LLQFQFVVSVRVSVDTVNWSKNWSTQFFKFCKCYESYVIITCLT